jgi:starch synthase (maltosyl-transferring)
MSIFTNKRVIITNLLPKVENGEYPAKAIQGDPVNLSADIFSDGHNELDASVWIKHKSEKQWKEFLLEPTWNDRWTYAFTPTKLGYYQFEVHGWLDHYKTWQKAFDKKVKANQDINVELLIGAEILEAAANKSKGKTAEELLGWSEKLKSKTDIFEATSLALDPKVAAAVRNCRSKDDIVVSQTLEIEVDRKKAGFSAWYELFPRSASKAADTHGTFADVIDILPEVARMGFDVLYMPPIHPIGEVNRKGRNNSLTATETDPGSPWAVGSKKGGHKAIHPELGTLEDFRKLVQEAHLHNMEVALDIAYQCAPDHPYVAKHPQWFKWRPDGTVQYAENPPKKYEDILPFNFDTSDRDGLWTELKGIIEYWIEQGVNIFRVDNPHTKSLPFWEWMIKEVKKENPQAIFLSEAFTRPRIMEQLTKGGFTQTYTYFSWRNAKRELQEYVTELTQTDLKYYFRPNFWPNTPDILTSMLVDGGENAHIMRVILAATMSSNYGIYGPVYEFGINQPAPGKEEYADNEKYEIKQWDWTRYTKTKDIIIRLNRIRKENVAFHHTTNIEFADTTSDHIIAYIKSSPTKEIC